MVTAGAGRSATTRQKGEGWGGEGPSSSPWEEAASTGVVGSPLRLWHGPQCCRVRPRAQGRVGLGILQPCCPQAPPHNQPSWELPAETTGTEPPREAQQTLRSGHMTAIVLLWDFQERTAPDCCTRGQSMHQGPTELWTHRGRRQTKAREA